ncbi:MAG: protein kinase [Acidobacteriota bacterium]
MIGKSLSHYRIIEKLGQGGMGEVFLAEDSHLNRRVAIKVLPDAFARDPERLARFDREAKLLATLSHPNIAAIHGLEKTEGSPFLVMELVEGETLAQRIARGPLAADEALEVCRQIAEGLECAHEKGIIHRDLKPANIKITPEGKVKILDFGLAKAFQEESASGDLSHSPTITEAMTRVGVILGTAAYMSPEQARGRPVDKRTDIWAFGCILFECLAGRQPFEGETITETLASILKGEPDWQAIPATTPRHIRELLHRCLQKDPRERIHDIADVRIEVTRVVSPAGISEGVPSRAFRRGRLVAALVITSVLAATAASIVTWSLKPEPEQPGARSIIDLPAGTQLTRETDVDSMGPAHTELALSPDGKHLVFSASPDGSPGKARLYLRPLDSFETTAIPGTEGARTPFFSPDGQ